MSDLWTLVSIPWPYPRQAHDTITLLEIELRGLIDNARAAGYAQGQAEQRQKIIELLCPYCAGYTVERDSKNVWLHRINGLLPFCKASPIHEAAWQESQERT